MLVGRRTKIVFIGIFILGLASSIALAGLSGSLSESAIAERLQPMGKVNIIGVDPNAASNVVAGVGGPEKIYADNCKMCHQTGLAGAPKLGVKGDWAAREQQGLDTLVKNAWVGIRGMPPKGNCLKCTEEDIRDTVIYMMDKLK